MKKLQYLFVLGAALVFTACGGGQTSKNTESEHADEHQHAGADEDSAMAEMLPASEGARVFFVNLEDGAVVTSPVKIEMGIEGMTIKPAGEITEGTGHHHLIINEGPTPYGTVVGADETHIHFGKGQTETELTLEPGEYTLTLQFADGFHRSYGEKVSKTIKITVE